MKRWNVELPEFTLELYYQDLETAKEKNPRAINITESFNYAYLDYVEKIKAEAKGILYDYRGRTVYKIPYNSAYILVRLWLSTEGGEEYYYDGCEFQRHDEHGFTVPIMWTSSTPEEFYKQFLTEDDNAELPVEFISLRELKKLKPVKFSNKDGKAYYKDSNGYFYFVYKDCLPNKRDREEYERFNGCKEAVEAKLYKNDYRHEVKWFLSEDALIQEYEDMKRNTPASYPQPFYEIRKHGYTMKAPEDRKIIIRLPYFRLNKEIEYEMNEHANSNAKSVAHWVARKWCGMMESYCQFGEAFKNMEWVEDLITRWREYLLKKDSQELAGDAAFCLQSQLIK